MKIATGLIETFRGRVAVSDCDQDGRMNVEARVARIADATVTLCHAIGLTADYMNAHGCTLVAVHHDIAHLGEVEAGDLLVMRGGVLSIDAEQIRFLHRMRRVEDGAAVMTSKVLMRGMDRERREPVALDASIVEQARQLLVREADA